MSDLIYVNKTRYTLASSCYKENRTLYQKYLDIFTKPPPLCLLLFPPSDELSYPSLASLYEEIAHLSMLFITQLTHTAGSQCQLRNNVNGAIHLKYTSCDGADNGQYNASGFMEISKISLMQADHYFGTVLFGRVLNKMYNVQLTGTVADVCVRARACVCVCVCSRACVLL